MSQKTTSILVRMSGGFGNQLFQLSAALHIAKKLQKSNIKIDLRFLKSYQTPRSFELDWLIKYFPNISAHYSELGFLGLISQFRIARILNRRIFKIGLAKDIDGLERTSLNSLKYLVLDGYFHDSRNFINEIDKKNILNILNIEFSYLSKKLNLPNLNKKVSIHIRRGDYGSNNSGAKEYKIIGMDYYRIAVRKFPKETVFFVFGDDANIIKEFSKEIGAVDVSSLNLSLQEEFSLMVESSGYIIANSTFSWWAAFLGYSQEKKIISPRYWFVDERKNMKNKLQLDYFELV